MTDLKRILVGKKRKNNNLILSVLLYNRLTLYWTINRGFFGLPLPSLAWWLFWLLRIYQRLIWSGFCWLACCDVVPSPRQFPSSRKGTLDEIALSLMKYLTPRNMATHPRRGISWHSVWDVWCIVECISTNRTVNKFAGAYGEPGTGNTVNGSHNPNTWAFVGCLETKTVAVSLLLHAYPIHDYYSFSPAFSTVR